MLTIDSCPDRYAPQGPRPVLDGLDFNACIPPDEQEGIRLFVKQLSPFSIVRRFAECKIAPLWTQAWVTKGWHQEELFDQEHFTVDLVWWGRDG